MTQRCCHKYRVQECQATIDSYSDLPLRDLTTVHPSFMRTFERRGGPVPASDIVAVMNTAPIRVKTLEVILHLYP